MVFGQAYTLVLGKAREALVSYVDQVGCAGYGLMQQAEAHVRSDGAAADRFNNRRRRRTARGESAASG